MQVRAQLILLSCSMEGLDAFCVKAQSRATRDDTIVFYCLEVVP